MKFKIIFLLMIIPVFAFSQRVKVIPSSATWDSISNITDTTTGELIFCTDCTIDRTPALLVFDNGEWKIITTESLDIPAAPTLDTTISDYNSIVWTWNTVSGATGYKWNIVNTYSTATDMDTVVTRTETGLTCNTRYVRYIWAYNNYGYSNVLTMVDTTTTCTPCDSLVITHNADLIAPVSKTVTYKLVTGISGDPTKCWIAQNLGATYQADSINDTTEARAGWYWQFNNERGYKYSDTIRTPSSAWTSSISENSNWTAENDPCTIELGADWHIPTSSEWSLVNYYWTDYTDAYDSDLKIHAAGYLKSSNGELYDRGIESLYWSSSQSIYTISGLFRANSTTSRVTTNYKSLALPIRCIREQ